MAWHLQNHTSFDINKHGIANDTTTKKCSCHSIPTKEKKNYKIKFKKEMKFCCNFSQNLNQMTPNNNNFFKK